MKRRSFLKDGAAIAAGSVFLPHWLSANNHRGEKFVILHTNDFHSHIDPFPDNHPQWPGMGGSARMETLIRNTRPTGEQFLLVDAGDIFQGTPYFNIFGGIPEILWMNRAGYHAVTLGNHDFDNGVEKLAEVLKHAEFDVVNCNYNVAGTALEGRIKQFEIYQRGKFKIGVTGVGISPFNLIPERLFRGVQYLDPSHCVNDVAEILKKKHRCDMVIVLSHLGYSYDSDKIDDLRLASKSEHIDCIVGGHTHTFLEKPVQVKNRRGKNVVISQAGWAGLRLGQLDFTL